MMILGIDLIEIGWSDILDIFWVYVQLVILIPHYFILALYVTITIFLMFGGGLHFWLGKRRSNDRRV